jgi:hypothetical protein
MNMDATRRIAELLKDRLNELGWDAREVTSKLGLPINLMILQKAKLNLDDVERVADYFGLNFFQLFVLSFEQSFNVSSSTIRRLRQGSHTVEECSWIPPIQQFSRGPVQRPTALDLRVLKALLYKR